MSKTKKSDNQILTEKTLVEVDSWGILTLMSRMKDVYIQRLNKERDILAGWHTWSYRDSSLENLDLFKWKFEAVYNREFKKIYEELERQYESTKS